MPITVKCSPEVEMQYKQLFADAKAIDPMLTAGRFFEKIVNSLSEGSSAVSAVDDEIQRYKELNHKLDEKLHNFDQEQKRKNEIISSVLSLLDLSDPELEKCTDEISKLKQRAMMVPAKVEVPEPLAENEIRFAIPEPHLSLLTATKERLSEKLGSTVTIRDVLLDIFIRYTVEMYNEWFYPFVIEGSEFKQITGYTQNELKSWLKKRVQE